MTVDNLGLFITESEKAPLENKDTNLATQWIEELEQAFKNDSHKPKTIELAQLTQTPAKKSDTPSQKITLADINQLKERVLNNDQLADKNNTWSHGLDLKELGLKMIGYDQSRGIAGKNFEEGLKHLGKGIKVLEDNLPGQPEAQKQVSAMLVTELMIDYAKLLSKPLEKLSIENAQKQRQEVDQLLGRTLKIAEDNKLPAFTQATILQQKGNNMAVLANTDLAIKHPDPAKPYSDEESAAFQNAMKPAMATLQKSLDLADTTESKIRILNDMAIWERGRGKTPGDDYAMQTRNYFKQTLDLLRNFDPQKEGKTPEERSRLTESKDQSFMKVYDSYLLLIDAEIYAFKKYAIEGRQLSDREIDHRDALLAERRTVQTEKNKAVQERSDRAKESRK